MDLTSDEGARHTRRAWWRLNPVEPTGATEIGGGAVQTTFDASGRLDAVKGTGKLTLLRAYNFTSTGRLTSIKDLNNNVGSYHQLSEKHLDTYLDEFEWRSTTATTTFSFAIRSFAW